MKYKSVTYPALAPTTNPMPVPTIGTTEPAVPPVAAPATVVVKVNPAVMPHRVNSSAMIDVMADVIKILFESTIVFF